MTARKPLRSLANAGRELPAAGSLQDQPDPVPATTDPARGEDDRLARWRPRDHPRPGPRLGPDDQGRVPRPADDQRSRRSRERGGVGLRAGSEGDKEREEQNHL